MKKTTLLEKINENRERHEALYREALVGWRIAVIDSLRDALDGFERDEKVDLNVGYKHPRPRHHLRDYDRILDMLGWESSEMIDLDADDFRRYVQDDWDWSREFASSNSQYTSI